MVHLKDLDEIVLMRRAGKVVAEVLDRIGELVRPGISTGELDRVAEEHIRSYGGTPTFKGYRPLRSMTPFPGTICTSINQEIVHGIPSEDRWLDEGDILSVDVGVSLDGYCGDAACTYPVGTISSERQMLLDVTEISLNKAIETAIKGPRASSSLCHALYSP